jgi:diguanylate cyclase (GGDEF)-like protein
MNDHLSILVCHNLALEAAIALRREGLSDVGLTTFPPEYCAAEQSWERLAPHIPPANAPHDRVYVLGGHCLARLGAPPPRFGHCEVRCLEQCCQFFVGAEVLEASNRTGAYTLTPGWLARWRDYVQKWGFDSTLAREFFKESATRLQLVDTEVTRHSQQQLEEFAEFVALDFKTLPVGLDYFCLYLSKLAAGWRAANEQRATLALANRASRQSADYAMAFDLIGRMAGIMSEDKVVEQVLELAAMLFAPEQALFATVEDGAVQFLQGFPAHDAAERAALQAALAAEGEAEWIEAERGFRVRCVHRDQTLGILHVVGFAFPEYKQDYLNIALVIAKVCGLAISNARIYQALGATVGELETEIDKTKVVERHLRHLSTHDFLTGLYNRTFFEEELARLGRSRQFPITIMMADVNDLKPVNDRYGHPAGDRLLQDVAQILQSAFRADEIVARIGGDEFAVILPSTDSWSVPRIEHRVRRAIAAYVAAEGFTLSLALGSATADEGEALTEIFKLADQRMYEDKQATKRRL